MSHYRVAGLSRFLKLGECVAVDVGDRVQIGEVVRIDDASATLKPFDARSDASIGARAYRTDNLSLSPHRSWKGRIVDALGRPIDGAGELACGDRSAPLDAAPPPPLRRGRVHAPLRTGVRSHRSLHPLVPGTENRRLRGLWGRQVVASGDAGQGDASRRRRHCAGRRARSRSARISPRHAWRGSSVSRRRRFDRRREPHDASSRPEDRDGDRRILPRSRRIGAADRQFGHPICSRRARCGAGGGRTCRRSRLCAKRLQRPAAAARARRAGRGRIGFDYRRLLRSGRWRRPQRSGRRCDSRRPRRAHRVGPRDCRRRQISGGQCSLVGIEDDPSRVAAGAAQSGCEPQIADRALRGDARAASHGRLHGRRRPDPRQGDQIGPAHL